MIPSTSLSGLLRRQPWPLSLPSLGSSSLSYRTLLPPWCPPAQGLYSCPIPMSQRGTGPAGRDGLGWSTPSPEDITYCLRSHLPVPSPCLQSHREVLGPLLSLVFSAVMCGVTAWGGCRAAHVGNLLQLWQQDIWKGLEKSCAVLQGCEQWDVTSLPGHCFLLLLADGGGAAVGDPARSWTTLSFAFYMLWFAHKQERCLVHIFPSTS